MGYVPPRTERLISRTQTHSTPLKPPPDYQTYPTLHTLNAQAQKQVYLAAGNAFTSINGGYPTRRISVLRF